jgi:hypothetical protein
LIPPVRLVLQPSSRLVACLGGLHLAAFLAAFTSLTGWPLLLVLTGTAVSAGVTLSLALLRFPGVILEIELQNDYSARWRDSSGSWHAGSLAREGYVGAGLVLMALDEAQDSRRRWVVMGADSAPQDSLRALRLVMRGRQDDPEMPHNHDAG